MVVLVYIVFINLKCDCFLGGILVEKVLVNKRRERRHRLKMEGTGERRKKMKKRCTKQWP